MCRLIFIMVAVCTTRTQKTDNNFHKDCAYNEYLEGKKCKVCPVGYFGYGCSNKCSKPSYGLVCSQECDCEECHHIFGCILTTETTGKAR